MERIRQPSLRDRAHRGQLILNSDLRKNRFTEPPSSLPSIPRLHRPLGQPKLFEPLRRIVDLLASARRALRAASCSLPSGYPRRLDPAFGLLAFTLFTAAYFLNAGQRLRFGRRGDLSAAMRPSVQLSDLSPRLRLIRTALFCTLITILLATLLELLQLALPNRSADWRDILWSTLGALTATLFPAFLLKPRLR